MRAKDIRESVLETLNRIPNHVLEDTFRGIDESLEGAEDEWKAVMAFVAGFEYIDLPWRGLKDTPRPDVVGAVMANYIIGLIQQYLHQ